MDSETDMLCKACEDVFHRGLCRMDCDSGDWCAEVEQEMERKEAERDQGRDAGQVRRVR